MPTPTRSLTIESARRVIRERSFAKSTGNRVGVELEWFTTPSAAPPDVATLERILAGADLPFGSAITFEPGGQVEISSPPLETVAQACLAAESDSNAARRILRRAGIGTFGGGFDQLRPHRLLTNAPRYTAMRRYFDAYGRAGGRMMCASAAIHVNVDAGHDDEGARRWRVAHLLGPTLVAAFANSPITEAGPADKSSRQRAWLELDPGRTLPAATGGDPVDDWTRYALDARVMFIRTDRAYVLVPDDLTFADWVDNGHALGYPDVSDLVYHLTTLFPPVRPHGHLELRMIDMLPEPWWRAAVALTATLVCDPGLHALIEASCAEVADCWGTAASVGLDAPALRFAAETCFSAALDSLKSSGCDARTVNAARAFVARFTANGLTPADEHLALGAAGTIAEAL